MGSGKGCKAPHMWLQATAERHRQAQRPTGLGGTPTAAGFLFGQMRARDGTRPSESWQKVCWRELRTRAAGLDGQMRAQAQQPAKCWPTVQVRRPSPIWAKGLIASRDKAA